MDKTCFIHVPKTGGSAVVTALQAAVGPGQMYQVHGDRAGQVPLQVLLTRYALVTGHFTLAQVPESVLRSAFTFTFLREPVDRVVSLFFFYREHPESAAHDPRMAAVKSLDFEEFVGRLDDRMSPWSNWQTYVFSGAIDCERPARELLGRALENLDRLHFVGVQDEVAAGVRRLAEMRGWPASPPVERVHATIHRPALREVSPAVLRRLEELNECDAVLFEHAQQRWAAARHAAAPARLTVATPLAAPAAAPTEIGTKEIVITAVEADSTQGTVTVRGYSHIATRDVTVGIRITDEVGLEIYGVNTRLLGVDVPVSAGHGFAVNFRMQMPLAPGRYHVTAAVHSAADHLEKNYHWIEHAASFAISPSSARFSGLVDLRASATLQDSEG